MSDLVSMKLSKKDRDARMGEVASSSPDMPAYPWGLSVTLDDDVLEKLGLGLGDFTVGNSMTLIAKVDVTACSSNETKGQDARVSVSLQITDLCLEDSGSKATKAADALYGDT